MASDAEIVGKTFEESADLKRAWTGEVAASCQDFGDAEDDREAALGIALLEVQSPLDDYFTGDLIAVVEFYQNGAALAHELADARRKSWMVVGGAFLASGMLLFGIVQAGGRTIDRQRKMLETRLAGTRAMAVQNAEFKRRLLQEALSNAARHAGTDRARVRVETGPGGLQITVSDSGAGFGGWQSLRLRQGSGQGLLGLVDRAESIGGMIEIDSAPGQGTRVTLTLPREDRSR